MVHKFRSHPTNSARMLFNNSVRPNSRPSKYGQEPSGQQHKQHNIQTPITKCNWTQHTRNKTQTKLKMNTN